MKSLGSGGAEAPSSLWTATAGVGGKFPKLSEDLTVDVAVIGGGFLGLSTALHLAEKSRDVALIEANTPGWGASGRNGGQVIPGLKYDPDEIEKMFGAQLGPNIVETVGGAADYLFDLVRRHNIKCDANQSGWIQAVHSQKSLKKPMDRAQQWLSRGANIEVLDASQIAALTGSNAHVGGWIDKRGGSVQPLALVQGLAKTASAAGARIFSGTPGIAIERHKDRWLISTPDGQLSAAQVVIATNGYTDKLWPGLRRTIVPVNSMQVATAPLPEQFRQQILPGRQVVSDTKNLLRYFRVDTTGRLIMGSRGPFRSDITMKHAKGHVKAIAELFPEIRDIKLDYAWAGKVAMTADHMPHIHQLAPGVVTALGFNGRGVALGVRLGRALADLIDGYGAEEIGFPVSPMKPIIGHVFAPIAARSLVQYYRLKDAII